MKEGEFRKSYLELKAQAKDEKFLCDSLFTVPKTDDSK
jgi:hypothetical protein